ncbi:Serine phosphatase RsbU, regulator of sigma subunit [Modestobacter sp. DSM 44400]|uniref:SpoIIE family protein phosphatase n=1 Tax=Modestobacter sp. DSM 44400 TaxID=1550230 RepID=UPI00089CE287|nr:SpoIIE family protein phosphatase [Modestobacter sp. DSM 44400]SDY98036.1 Serine phosphatase RsbU, regulator of sigma subunit [Modestobacter sp. DSM 44400]
MPLLSGGRTIGLLSLYRDAGHPLWTQQELRAAADVAARAGTALDNARLFTAQAQLAEGLQRSLLTDPPEPDHAEIVVRYLPAVRAARVGGDWYDALIQPSGSTMLVIGDVAGHDTAAAATMGQLRSLLRGIAAYSDAGPAEVLRGLDAAMESLMVPTPGHRGRHPLRADRRRGPAGGDPDGVGQRRPSAAAGPNPRRHHRPVGRLRGDLLLGVDPATQRREQVISLDRGATVLLYTDGLILYTDGLIERRDLSLDEGMDRLVDAVTDLAGSSLDELERVC